MPHCGSVPIRSTEWPASAKVAPRLIVEVVFPTPPLRLTTLMTRAERVPQGVPVRGGRESGSSSTSARTAARSTGRSVRRKESLI